MSEDNDYDNEWGTKKQKYYSMNKRENNDSESDSDFIEDEKEAIRLQKLRAQKIKKTKILSEDEEEISEKEKKKEKKEENDINKNISFKPLEIDLKKILENINTLKYSLEEIQSTEDEIKIFEENKKLNSNLPKTMEYLKQYKKINILNSANILFNIISTLNQKMTGHHPSIKNTAIMNFLLNKNNDKNEEIQNNIEKILVNLEKDDEREENDKLNEEEGEEGEEGEEMDDNDIDLEEENEGDEGEEMNEEENENEEEEEGDKEEEDNKKINNKNKKENKNINKIISNKPPMLSEFQEKIKKPSFLSKKKKREKEDNKEIDLKNNENFDNDSSEDEDSFIKEQYKSFNKLNKEKELLDLKKKENEKKEIEMKNDFAVRKANKEVLKARGIYRKRKKYQGNAKLMNREKFYKKEKERRKMVKEYEGKPDVYMGEATGIRRDLVRSTKIH